ncbi:hypothetical protein N657DRAFT_691240 [Parathielavia appendiculata]|uniref:Ribosomal protein S15 n=1 Tax=Parathielavia appendiculata TaxID=2587402 RepID=A0AAN6TXZ0_9PEZI|nr:hypothetical protein N657DRAFT_691240 [Parathielavia appendiculata]
MPPRIPAPQGLRSLTLCIRPTPTPSPTASLLPMVQSANISMREKKKRMKQDPYGWAQAQQRKNANLKRREELAKERQGSWGDPVHGVTTPFVESFDTAGQEPFKADATENGESCPLPTSPHLVNYLLTKEELEKAIEDSRRLTQPLTGPDSPVSDPAREEQELEEHAQKHAKAQEALQRITSLQNGSAKDRKHANIRRCIETFGRHVTDHSLENPIKPPARGYVPREMPVRAGPDTGSSEVQIAILTSKIRALALALEGPKGHKDKNNKRSLRLLCHKRQKLLRYLERKERGSGRWQHLVETLGLTPATYKGQISI